MAATEGIYKKTLALTFKKATTGRGKRLLNVILIPTLILEQQLKYCRDGAGDF